MPVAWIENCNSVPNHTGSSGWLPKACMQGKNEPYVSGLPAYPSQLFPAPFWYVAQDILRQFSGARGGTAGDYEP